MDDRRLGSSSLRVSPVGLGTVKLGRNTRVKYPRAFDLPSDAEVEALLEGAWELGVRLFDTAPAYGSSEERIAPFVARHRDELVLVGKCGESYLQGESSYDFRGASLRRSVEASLERLGTERIDVLLLHSNGDDERILTEGDGVETLLALKHEGKAELVGISAKTEKGIALGSALLDVVMAPYSLAAPGLAVSLQEAHAKGSGVLAIKGLGSGHLAGAAVEADRALDHVFSADFIDCLVVGTLSLSHLAQATAAADRRP